MHELQALYDLPLLELVFRAAQVHRQYHDPRQVQVCRLISIKTGACPEDCAYCSQSARYDTGVAPQPLMDLQNVLDIARSAKSAGITRICMGAAWRQVTDSRSFDRVLEMVRDVTALGLEVCCTLGMLTEDQARRLEAAGLYAYNHNIDTSEQYYPTIISTRAFADRLQTIQNVRKTSLTVCCGGIIGLGETAQDRLSMLLTLCRMNPHPESVPINILCKVAGTPLHENPDVPVWETVRMIAMARLLMPASTVRLSAGRAQMSFSDQSLCFLAGANSIFSSDQRQYLTSAAPSQDYDQDRRMFDVLGLVMRPPFSDGRPTSVPDPLPQPAAVGD